ncbi:MAG: galactose-1-phosphate uridylyltransferase, partial [Aggregatilineales bacterium]
MEDIIATWQREYTDLGAVPYINHVQIFENKGSVMGCSNPHPHGQLWASEHLPQQILLEDVSQREHWQAHGRSLLADYLEVELELGERLIHVNEHFAVLVPFWAVWPFETLLISRRHVGAMTDLDAAERDSLAEALHALTVRYDNLFQVSFPYSAGFHVRPTLQGDWAHWHFHAHF